MTGPHPGPQLVDRLWRQPLVNTTSHRNLPDTVESRKCALTD
jgi:hypothetical protein